MRDRFAALPPLLEQAAERRPRLDPATRRELDDALSVARQDYRADPETAGPAEPDPLDALAEAFGLDHIDEELIVIAAAADLDGNLALTIARLHGGGPARMTVALALELTGIGTLDPAGIERLGSSSRLVRYGLVELGPGPWLGRDLGVPERVLAHLLGARPIDPQIRALIVEPVPLVLEGTEILTDAVARGTAISWIHARPGTAGVSMAAAAFAAAGLQCLCIDLDRAPADTALPPLLLTCGREAALLGAGLVIGGAGRIPGSGGTSPLLTLAELPVPVIAVGDRPWERTWLDHFPITVEAPTLAPADRAAAWVSIGADPAAEAGLAGLRLTPEAIAQTAGYAQRLALARGEALTPELVRQAARRVGGSATPARNTGSRTHFADLVLPEHVDASLRRLVGWARHRDEALSRGSLLSLGNKGTGLAALFTGSPGTGKTLAAHVIADELGIDLIQVDLSTVVDKYIGETEKNLERLFQQAESLNVVLFFDEADALFGRRSEVKDAHDRHANQEVAYLLQRMENFDGLTILATNLRGNLDPAFNRRMDFVVHFPDPDVPTRRRLWSTHLDRLGALDDADPMPLDDLAALVDLSGGDIRNIVLAAGYDCAAAGELPGFRHVRAAVVGEFQKLGRRVPGVEFLAAP